MNQFENIFGPELKSIVLDPSQVDNVLLRVNAMVDPIRETEMNIYDVNNNENWVAIMEWFNKEVIGLEQVARYFIDESFKTLRSSDEALQMLLKFKNIDTRESIKEQLMTKFYFIMQQFSKEIATVESVYVVCIIHQLEYPHIVYLGYTILVLITWISIPTPYIEHQW